MRGAFCGGCVGVWGGVGIAGGSHSWIPQLRALDLEPADSSAAQRGTADDDIRDLLEDVLAKHDRLQASVA